MIKITPKSIKLLVKSSIRVGKNHLPTLLTITAVSGLVATCIMVNKASVEAKDILAHKAVVTPNATKLEMAASVLPTYAPAIALGALTVTCIIGSNSLNLRKQAAIASACTLAEDALKEYQDKIKEKLGVEQMNKDIVSPIMEDRVEKSQLAAFPAPMGQLLCMEAYTGRYFSSTPKAIEEAEHKLNVLFREQNYACLNDFYTFLGLDHTAAGEVLGWNSRDYHDDRYWVQGIDDIEFAHSSVLADEQTMCYVVRFNTCPKAIYTRY